MCWSFQASVSFSVIEGILISFIFIRAARSKQKYVRQQMFILPMMISVFGETLSPVSDFFHRSFRCFTF